MSASSKDISPTCTAPGGKLTLSTSVSSNQSNPASDWHNEASSAIFSSPTDEDPSTHAFIATAGRRASCPYDGTCDHQLQGKTCACGLRCQDAAHENSHVGRAAMKERKLSRESYDDYKRGWYAGWLGDKSEERAQPWGFSSTHASRSATPTPGT